MWDGVSEGCLHSPDVFVVASLVHRIATAMQGPVSFLHQLLTCGSSVLQEENVGSAVSFALGVNRARHIQLVSIWDDDADYDHPSSPTSSLAAEAAKAQAKVRAYSVADTNLPASVRLLNPSSRVSTLGSHSRDVDVPARLQVKQQEAAAFSRSMKGVGGRLQGA